MLLKVIYLLVVLLLYVYLTGWSMGKFKEGIK